MKKLADLPHFESLEFLRMTEFGMPGFSGRFDHIESVAEGVCRLRIAADKYAKGTLYALNQSNRTAIFTPLEHGENLGLGMDLPWIDGYWNENDVEMVVDPTWAWKRLRFGPTDAWKFDTNAGAILSRTPRDKTVASEDVKLVPAGWDHVHCRFCWKTIGPEGEAEGYRDDHNVWLCGECYHTYVLPHDVSFMSIFGRRWPAESSSR